VPRLSIIIPASENLKQLEDSLVSVLENRPDDCQVVVALREPYDDPYDLKEEVVFLQSSPGCSLNATVNAAVTASSAPVVHLLACGAAVSPGWAEAVLPHFEDPQVAAVAPLLLRCGTPDDVLAAGVGYWAAGVARRIRPASLATSFSPPPAFCGPDRTAAFYRKSALEAVGLFDEALDGAMAAIDVGLRLRQAGFRCVYETQSRVYADAAVDSDAGTFLAGKEAEQFFWRWASANGWLRSLALHSLLLAGECIEMLWRPSMAARLTGRLIGGYQILRHPRLQTATVTGGANGSLAVARPHFSAPIGYANNPRQ